MKFEKSSSKWIKNSKKGSSLVLHFLQKVAMFPNFGQNKLATLPKFVHWNRARLPNHVLGTRQYHDWKHSPVSKDTIWKHCPNPKYRKCCQLSYPQLGNIATFWRKCSRRLKPFLIFFYPLRAWLFKFHLPLLNKKT